MRERERQRKRLFNAKNLTIGSGVLTVLAKVIYNDLKNENSFIKKIFRKISGSFKISSSDNIIDVTDSVKIIESDKNIKEKIL